MTTTETPRRRTYGGLHEAPTTYLFGVSKKTFYVFATGVGIGILLMLFGFWLFGAVVLALVLLAWAPWPSGSADVPATSTCRYCSGGGSRLGEASTSCEPARSPTSRGAGPACPGSARPPKCGGESTSSAADSA
ncbi:hypothetical protein GS934_01985 [Rhodococcus hoagii]|nr:hypothetical protein [Prescottella equi]NKZ86889.1 hypothetical protein [Prescottella equi]